MEEIKLFDTASLADLFKTTPNALYLIGSKIRRGILPATALPKPLSLPSRRMLWDARDVQRWLDVHRPSRVGHPTKLEQIAKRQAGVRS
ncbi:MAG: hypothetical protein U1A72_20400 [Sulfuritalea sp.]|nr:hypothetical protein [Sulfuritalea sp.]